MVKLMGSNLTEYSSNAMAMKLTLPEMGMLVRVIAASMKTSFLFDLNAKIT